jgi:hypothetical protein
MSARKRKKAPRSLTVNRGGAWGHVRYLRKRAYCYGHHCPADALGIERTAMLTAFMQRELRAINFYNEGRTL